LATAPGLRLFAESARGISTSSSELLSSRKGPNSSQTALGLSQSFSKLERRYKSSVALLSSREVIRVPSRSRHDGRSAVLPKAANCAPSSDAPSDANRDVHSHMTEAAGILPDDGKGVVPQSLPRNPPTGDVTA